MNSDPNNRRAYPRFDVNLLAFICTKTKDYPAEVLNISEGGALIRCTDPIASVGEEINVKINFGGGSMLSAKIVQADQTEVELGDTEECIIRWAVGDSGQFGVQFVDLSPDKRQYIRDLVQSNIS